jgi:hypothetical protein
VWCQTALPVATSTARRPHRRTSRRVPAGTTRCRAGRRAARGAAAGRRRRAAGR